MTIFNRGVRGRRSADGTNIGGISDSFVENKYPVPSITSWSISGSDDTALNPAGGQTVLVNGGGFATGVAATLNGATISPVTLVSPTQISFTSPALSGGSYTLIVYNSTGGAAILVPGLTYSSVPTYTTSAGSIGTVYETKAINTQVVATSDSSITYSLASGSLPSGATLYANGVITGTAPVDSSSTTYTFAVTATDAELQDVTRTFTLTINTDVVTWVTPSSGSTITLDGTAYSQALSATDAAGYSIASYTANALPTGLTLTSGTISGTPTVEGSTTTLLTATAATTNRSATSTVTWVVSLGDINWKYVSLLLSGSTPTTTFINDASLNNIQLTIVGDTRPTNFDPYMNGYYSNYFDGSGDYLTIADNAILELGSSPFTIEGWAFCTTGGSNRIIVGKYDATTSGSVIYFGLNTSNQLKCTLYYNNNGEFSDFGMMAFPLNRWNHVAVTRDSSSVCRVFVNGVSTGTTATVTAPLNDNALSWGIGASDSGQFPWIGYLSNVRIIKGSALYITTFTPPTAPLTAVANTSLLICQSNRLIDDSFSNSTITKNGDTTVSSAHPFTTPTTVAYNTAYSLYFPATNYDNITYTASSSLLGAGDWTIETWAYALTLTSFDTILQTTGNQIILRYSGNTGWQLYYDLAARIVTFATAGTNGLNTWTHHAVTRSGSTMRWFINGVLVHTGTSTTDYTGVLARLGATSGSYPYNGYISNVRMVKGTSLYNSNFTPSTSPLTNISGTTLLTNSGPLSIDYSNNNSTVALSSSAVIYPSDINPFTSTANTTITRLGSSYFSATSSFLSYAPAGSDAFGTGDFTVECWVNLLSSASVNLTMASSTTNSWQFLIYLNQLYWQEQAGNLSGAGYGTIPLNTWTHVACTRSGTTFRWFVNGIQVGSTTTSFNYSGSPTTRYIGPANGGSAPFLMSDFRIIRGTALYTSNFLPPQTPLSPVTNTTLLTCQYNGGANNNGFVDQSNFTNIINRNGNATQGTFSPYSQTGWSNYFAGASQQYFTLPTSAATAFGGFNGNFTTIEFWAYQTTSSASNTNEVIGTWAAVAVNGRWYVEIGNGAASTGATSKVFFTWTTGTGSVDSVTTTAVVPVNQWVHIAIVVNATGSAGSHTVNVYVNGTGQSFTSRNFSSQTSTYDRLRIGGNSSSYFYGYLSNLRVVRGTTNIVGYTGSTITIPTLPFTPATGTVLLTCESNRFVDDSPNNIILTPVSTPSVEAFSPFGGVTSVPTSYSVYFDGNGDYLTVPGSSNFVFAGDYTIEAWIYSSSTTWSIYSTGGSGASDQFSCDTGTLYWAYNIFGGGTANFFTSADINKWTHVAASRSSGTTRLFKNGTVIATSSTNESIGSTNTVNIGRRLDGVYLMNGYISNFRIVKGTALYTGAFTPPTTPLTAVANTLLLTCQNATMIDNSTNSFIVTSIGDSIARTFNPFGLTNTIGVAYSPSIVGGSFYFDGDGTAKDYLQINGTSIYNFNAGDFTVETWVYYISRNLNAAVPVAQNTDFSGTGWAFNIETNMTVSFTKDGTNVLTTTATVKSYVWCHLAVTRSGTTVKIFIDGVQSASTTYSTSIAPGSPYLRVGSDSTASFLIKGFQSDIRIVPGMALYTSSFVPPVSPLTSTANTAVLLSGTSGGIIDYHSANNLETVGNTQLASEDPYGGSYYSVYSDGNGDYLTVPSATWTTLAGTFTVEFWALWTIAPASAGSFMGVQTNGGWTLYNDSTRITPNIFGTGNIFNSTFSPSSIVPGRWYHIAVTRNSSNLMTMWVNGVSVGSTTTSASYTQGAWAIHSPGNVNLLNGYISNLRVTNTTLYTTTFTPPTSPLTAVSGTQLLTCQSRNFADNSTNAATLTAFNTVSVKSINPFQQNTGKSLYFDGSGDYMTTYNLQNFSFGTGDFTVEFWLYFNSVASDSAFMGSGNGGFDFCWRTSTGLNIGRINTAFDNTFAWSPTVGQWYYVAYSRSGTSLRVFVNGTQVGTTATNSQSYNAATYVVIGASTTAPDRPLNGYIKDFRITKGVARYTTTFTPPTSPIKTS